MSDKDDRKDDIDPYKFFNFGGDDDKNKKKNNQPKKFPFWALLLAVIAIIGFVNMFSGPRAEQEYIEFSEFKKEISDGKIVKVDITENIFTGYYSEPAETVTPNRKVPAMTACDALMTNPSNAPQVTVKKSIGVISENVLKFLDDRVEETKNAVDA